MTAIDVFSGATGWRSLGAVTIVLLLILLGNYLYERGW